MSQREREREINGDAFFVSAVQERHIEFRPYLALCAFKASESLHFK